MVLPVMTARIEERSSLFRQRINSDQVRLLMKIAMVTPESQIRRSRGTSMFARHDVIDMQRHNWRVVFGQSAILALKACAAPNQVPQCLVHRGLRLLAKTIRAFD